MNPLAIGAAVGLGLLALFAGSGKSKETGAPGDTSKAPKRRETAAEAFARGERETRAKVEGELKAKRLEEKRIGKLVDRELMKRGAFKPGKVADLGDDDDDEPETPKKKEPTA